MGWEWSLVGALGVGVGLLFWALALFVFLAAPSRRLNKILGLTFFCNGVNAGCGSGLMYLVSEYQYGFAFQIVAYAAFIGSIALYSVFLGMALNTPLVAPFRTRVWKIGMIGAVVVAETLLLTRTSWFSRGLYDPGYGTWENSGGPGSSALFYTYGGLAVIGLVAAFHTFVRAEPGTAARYKARLYAVAFATMDVPLIAYSFLPFVLSDEQFPILLYGVYASLSVFPLLLAYAILRGQLFDLDIRLKTTLRRGVLASGFPLAYLVFSQIGENILNRELGILAGGIAAALLLLLLAPLQRFSHRVADAAIPGVKDTQQYQVFRKMEVYKDTLESFLVDGTLSERERTALDRLRVKLGLQPGAVAQLEADVRTGVSA